MAQTAITQAINELNSKIFPPRSNTALGVSIAINVLKKYLEIEKEQMVQFAEQYQSYLLKFKKGAGAAALEMEAEQYYNETYGGN